MVKFGRHLSFFARSEQYEANNHYIVPYNLLRDKINSNTSNNPPSTNPIWCLRSPSRRPPTDEECFSTAWREILGNASADFAKATGSCWSTIYSSISNIPEARGAPLESALQLYTPHVGVKDARDMLVVLKGIHSTARVNAEALRKLVKKYDKQVKGCMKLSEVLLPELYTSIVAVGQSTLEMAIEIIRCILENVEYAQGVEDMRNGVGGDDTDTDIDIETETLICIHGDNNGNGNGNGNGNYDEKEKDAPYHLERLNDTNPITITSTSSSSLPIKLTNLPIPPSTINESESFRLTQRANESAWLHSFTSQMTERMTSPICIKSLVAHRGFHDPLGRSDLRPLENSLAAFEAAWSSGIHLCECDVALTRDEKIVLAHDENFRRLALDPDGDGNAGVAVGELTLKELIALTLKNGVRAPLLIDVLRSAAMIGGEARLIIEIKPGNTDVAVAVARLLGRYPEIMDRVALIMSFDLWCMHQLSSELMRVTGQLGLGEKKGSMSMSGVSTATIGGLGGMPRNSYGLLGPPRTSIGSMGNGGYPSNGFLPSSSIVGAFPSTGMLHQSFGSFSHLLTMDEENEKGSSTKGSSEDVTRGDSKSSSNSALAPLNGILPPISIRATSPLPVGMPVRTPQPIVLPALMLLTVSSAPEHPAELYVDIEDTSPVQGWLENGTRKLDGIYVRYQAKMKEPNGAAALKALSARYRVGVWLLKGEDPDDCETLQFLAEECGVSYFNSDLPRTFF